ncbi:putative holliday junction resolvase [Lampropedia hyalina DSM 16112]|jgi:putative Holliday junction resolvase|uniref:Putative pre-16S rRNA nuclease n=1 Tax=Lampropedia hyalina DSM 16112 TaxID=1122156 RepID=A0A1M4UGN3_9BURK|nr:putative holliday junction resolvase [Lampropedia hyalina DSM 16112]
MSSSESEPEPLCPPAEPVDAADAAQGNPPVQPHWQTFMALDYGLKRTGVAVGTRMLRSASPRGTIAAEGKARFAQVQRYLTEWQPDALVVGVPFHPDGAAHENTLRARKFIRQLRGRFGLPVLAVDERYSTTAAYAAGATEANADAVSACIILEQFFRSLEP